MKPNLTKFPKTDYNYTAVALTGNGCCAKRIANAHAFRKLSQNYFEQEAPGEFATIHQMDCRDPNIIYTAEINDWRSQKILLKPQAMKTSAQ